VYSVCVSGRGNVPPGKEANGFEKKSLSSRLKEHKALQEEKS
jgi:hypothetical protein